MAVTYGFFDSINGDRKYSADEFGQIFEGIISDGVMANSRNGLEIKPYTNGSKIIVSSGKAWFNNHYIVNDTDYTIDLVNPVDKIPSGSTIPAAVIIATIYILIDTRNTDGGRSCSIKIAYGNVGSEVESQHLDPTQPNISTETGQYVYPLADVRYNQYMYKDSQPLGPGSFTDRRTFSTLLLETEEVSQALSQSY